MGTGRWGTGPPDEGHDEWGPSDAPLRPADRAGTGRTWYDAANDPRRTRARLRDPSDPRLTVGRPPPDPRPRARRPAGPRGPTGSGLPPRLPTGPTLAVASVAVLVAFVLGHATAGGGGTTKVATTSHTVVTSSTTTTTLITTTHTVSRGESLASIARRYGLTPDELAAANNITNLNHVEIGQVLKIPSPTTPTTAATTTTTKKRAK